MKTFVFGDDNNGVVIRVREREELFHPVLDELSRLGYHLLFKEE